MQDRFSLRFQNGEREGDRVAITAPRFTLGRRPGNSLQLDDASVSGQHAEFLVDEQGLLLRDLGSTNGTRLSGRKVTEARPAHGDSIAFGSLEAILEDAELDSGSPLPAAMPAGAPAAAPASASAASAASASAAGEGVERVTLEQVARSGKGSKVALIGVLVLVLGGGGAAAYLTLGGGGKRAGKQAPVAVVEGNLLGGASFEGDDLDSSWSADESAPTLFNPWGGAARSGADGARAALDAGEWAVLESELAGVSAGRSIELGGWLRARGDAAGRIGIAFLTPDGPEGEPGRRTTAWGPWIRDVTQHQEVRFAANVPPRATRARAIVEARATAAASAAANEDAVDASGTVDVDDVSLVDRGTAGASAAKIGEYALRLGGEPPTTIHLTKVNKSLVAELRAEGPDRLRDHPLSVSAGGGAFQVSADGASSLVLRVEPDVAAAGIATIGQAGFAEQGPDFEAEGVTSVLLGGGYDLVALEFDRPVKVTGRGVGGADQLRIEHSGGFRLRVDFNEQRALAGDLAFAANKAEQEGRLGDCLAKWNELLQTAPYEADLVQEARATRSRIEQAGLVELASVEETFEQANFFRLVDLFRQCRARANAVGAKYTGSAVEVQAAELVTRIDESLSGLETDLNKDEVERLQSIHRVLQATESKALANEVQTYLSERYGVEN